MTPRLTPAEATYIRSEATKKAALLRTGAPVAVRILRRVVPLDSGCWAYDGRHGNGRPVITRGDGKGLSVYRELYQTFIERIPEGYEIHHTCLQRWCVNPTHLQPVPAAKHVHEYHDSFRCGKGHEYDYVSKAGKRICRICRRDRMRRQARPPISVLHQMGA